MQSVQLLISLLQTILTIRSDQHIMSDPRISDEARKAVNDRLINNDLAVTQQMQTAAKSW